MKGSDPNSERSKRRRNRGFVSLDTSSRKHRRAKKRMLIKCTVGASYQGNGGTTHEPGFKADPPLQGKIKTFTWNCGGSMNYKI